VAEVLHPKRLRIIEIQDRTVQGRTKPFLCKCEDGDLYYVKGADAGPRSLICEWLAGTLARSLNLPVPTFCIAEAPEALVRMHPEGRHLGVGPLFASKAVPAAVELGFAHASAVSSDLRRLIAVFDWWIHNDDRSLTAHGGNPNLLWLPTTAEIAVIDHNLAFSDDFNRADFVETHVFAADFLAVTDDLVDQGMYSDLLGKALTTWCTACDAIPPEWWYHDEACTVETNFSLSTAKSSLDQCTEESFWRYRP
jgi:hypothetical protein